MLYEVITVEAMHRLLSLSLDKVRAAGAITETAVFAIIDAVMGFTIEMLQTTSGFSKFNSLSLAS